jgi:hypothetical protein
MTPAEALFPTLEPPPAAAPEPVPAVTASPVLDPPAEIEPFVEAPSAVVEAPAPAAEVPGAEAALPAAPEPPPSAAEPAPAPSSGGSFLMSSIYRSRAPQSAAATEIALPPEPPTDVEPAEPLADELGLQAGELEHALERLMQIRRRMGPPGS